MKDELIYRLIGNGFDQYQIFCVIEQMNCKGKNNNLFAKIYFKEKDKHFSQFINQLELEELHLQEGDHVVLNIFTKEKSPFCYYNFRKVSYPEVNITFSEIINNNLQD